MRYLILVVLVLVCGCVEPPKSKTNYNGSVKTNSQNGAISSVEVTYPGATAATNIKNREEADRMLQQLDALQKALKSARDQMPEGAN